MVGDLKNISRYYHRGFISRSDAFRCIRDVLGDITDDFAAQVLAVSFRGSDNEIMQVVRTSR